MWAYMRTDSGSRDSAVGMATAVFERAKSVHALDRAATVIGTGIHHVKKIWKLRPKRHADQI
jgi:hypothetical protein